jgi:hypothetical protein
VSAYDGAYKRFDEEPVEFMMPGINLDACEDPMISDLCTKTAAAELLGVGLSLTIALYSDTPLLFTESKPPLTFDFILISYCCFLYFSDAGCVDDTN